MIVAILIDLLEGANARLRLSDAAAADRERQLQLFEERCSVFIAAFGVQGAASDAITADEIDRASGQVLAPVGERSRP